MQLVPDWRQIFSSPEKIEEELEGLKFAGPGLYCTETDTIIVIPIPKDVPVTPDNIWNWKWPEGTRWEVNVYNCPIRETFLGYLHYGTLPSRQNSQYGDKEIKVPYTEEKHRCPVCGSDIDPYPKKWIGGKS